MLPPPERSPHVRTGWTAATARRPWRQSLRVPAHGRDVGRRRPGPVARSGGDTRVTVRV